MVMNDHGTSARGRSIYRVDMTFTFYANKTTTLKDIHVHKTIKKIAFLIVKRII